MRASRPAGQASVELVALLPLIALGLLAALQLVLAGHAAWSASRAAHEAARAHAVGGDARAAARRELAAGLERRLRLRVDEQGTVDVRLAIPRLLAALDLGHVSARAHFEPQT